MGAAMSEWKAKRFWKETGVAEADGGWQIQLDGRPVRTPLKAALAVPTRALAEAVAAEWAAQEDEIKPLEMPFTRSANAAIDKVATQKAEVVAMLAAYADSDLLCYRAEAPEGLVLRQAEIWDPALRWATETLGVTLEPRVGVIHVAQDPGALERVHSMLDARDPFALTALHDLISLSGSAILGIAAAMGWNSSGAIWEMSRVDEIWQEEQWGRDDQAHSEAEKKRAAFEHAKAFHDLSQS